jgi:hypothetical protein
MNAFGWLGNQLWLGREWQAAIAASSFAAGRQRTLWHEIGSLAPDFVYGIALAWLCWLTAQVLGRSRTVAYASGATLWLVAIATPLLGTANASLLPWRVTLLTLVLALAIMLPITELVWRRLGRTPQRAAGPTAA